MAVTNFIQVNQNSGQKISSDTVLTRIGTLDYNSFKSMLMALNGKAENICFYGLNTLLVSGMNVYVTKGALAQYVDATEMMLAVQGADSSSIAISASHATLNRIDIIQAKIERLTATPTSVMIRSGGTSSPSTVNIDYNVQITLSAKSGTAGTGISPVVDTGYIKIAEITVPAAATEILSTNINDLYSQNLWISNLAPVVMTKSIDRIRTDLDSEIARLDQFVLSFQNFATSGNTTHNSTLFPQPLNSSSYSGYPGYTDANPFAIDISGDGRVRFGVEYIKPKDFYVDENSLYRCEDERIFMRGDWRQDDTTGFYWTEKFGDAVWITFQGIGLIGYFESDTNATNQMQVKVDTASASSVDLNQGISVGDSSSVQLATGLPDGVHTVKLSLNENKRLSWRGFGVINPTTSSLVMINKGSHYVLDTLITFNSAMTQVLDAYTGNGKRDLFFVNRTGALEYAMGDTVDSTSVYGDSAAHTKEEISYELSILKYYNTISYNDDWSGIYATSTFTYGDVRYNYITGLNTASDRIELRFLGTGLDADLLISAGNINIEVDGVNVGAITPAVSERQLKNICSNLVYGSHRVSLTFSSVGATVSFYGGTVYRPITPKNNYDDKMAIGAINRIPTGVLRKSHIIRVGLCSGAGWSSPTSAVACGGYVMQNVNTSASETMTIDFVGARIDVFTHKDIDKGIFNITIDNTTFTNIDCYNASASYNALAWSSSGNITLAWGYHRAIITTTNTKTGSSSGKTLQFTNIGVDEYAWCDYENNCFNSKTEVSRKKGISQTFKDLQNKSILEHDWNQKEHNNLQSQITTININLTDNFRRQKTYGTKYGFWGDILWKSVTEISIKPKQFDGQSWIGAILNDGSYLELFADVTVTLDINSLDGIGQIQTNSFYQLYAYKDSVGTLAFGLMYMPYVAIDANNPTTTVTLVQLNAKDVKSLFPVDANLAMWESTSKFDTPDFYYGGSYNPDRNVPIVVSYPTTNQVTVNSAFGIANYSKATPAYLYVVSGFKPIDCNTGNINSVIGTRGYLDTGIRILSGTGNDIVNFYITDGIFMFTNGAGAANGSRYTLVNPVGTSYTQYKLLSTPPDKKSSLIEIFNTIVGGSSSDVWIRMYYDTYGQRKARMAQAGSAIVLDQAHVILVESSYGILSAVNGVSGTGSAAIFEYGYEI